MANSTIFNWQSVNTGVSQFQVGSFNFSIYQSITQGHFQVHMNGGLLGTPATFEQAEQMVAEKVRDEVCKVEKDVRAVFRALTKPN